MAMKLFALPAGCACVAGCVAFSSSLLASGNPAAGRVAADFAAQQGADVWHYAVPAMSEIQRLADVYPSDGTPNGTIRIVAAKDEYEPGSFLVWAKRDLGKVKFELEEFKQVETGVVFPKENLDLKVVKVWYQNRNGWFSYFGDTGFKLCPELLLNDEDLIRVDTKKEANYAKLVDKDGKKTERWINPPHQMDERQLCEGWRKADTFLFMREDFRDAPTLQPVTLPKNEFRSFFLTAHVTKEIPAGLYKGEIVLSAVQPSTSNLQPAALGRIPVEIRVLDFTLPQPKCYEEPEKDLFVSTYNDAQLGRIFESNGGDEALARKQFLSIMKNMVAHNETITLNSGSFNNTTFVEIDAMREAGMRMDVFHGGAGPAWNVKDEKLLKRRARIIADEYDRRYGHHNLYMGYGDEEGPWWFVEQRPIFEAYQDVGLKFYIAGSTVFSKSGYFYDWHNAARDATDGTLPTAWRKMQGASHVAWYANQHVGAENPALSRRQNGLGAYLAGYTALCNYEFALGPYNDDRTTYKPMVLAYGTGDGVIDTLAWEGFREGVDDIRYATLLTDFARKAAKSKDRKTRYLGSMAMNYLAQLDAASCDMDSVRGEMIRHITALKPLVAPYAVPPETAGNDVASAKAGAARAEASLQAEVKAALAKVEEAKAAKTSKPADVVRAHQAVANLYAEYGRETEGGDYLVKQGLLAEAIRFYGWHPEKQRELRDKLYQKEKSCFWERLPEHPEIIADFDEIFFGKLRPTDTNGWKNAARQLAGSLRVNHAYVYGVRPQAFAAVYRKLVPVADKWGVAIPAGTAKNAVWAFLQLHDPAGVADAAKRGLADKQATHEERYYLGLAAALAKTSGRPASFAAAAKKFNATVADLSNEERVNALCAYGSARMLANDEDAVRGLDDFRKSLYKPEPKKRYVVSFSETPITGMSDMTKVTAERQACDRRFGGNLEFMTTDVTTGSRVAGDSKEALADPTMEIVCDVRGIHVLIRQADAKAKAVELGLVGNCSLEGYIAPGANTPYECFCYSPQSDEISTFNTMYATFGHRPMVSRTTDRKFRFESAYDESEAMHHLFFSWENWMQRIPANGAVWDFEVMCWHRAGNSCWNGTESIHGRSTWGEIEFRLTKEQRAKIVKPLLVKAYAAYRAENECGPTRDGSLSRWKDPVTGDREFHFSKVKPVVDRLNKYGQLITADMTDDVVLWLEREALPGWQDIAFEVDRLRARWLLERNAR